MRVTVPDHRKSEKGISLIEIAIALIVIGLIIIPLTELYRLQQLRIMKSANNDIVEKIAQSLNKFAQQNERLPFPANPTLNTGDVNNGTEMVIPTGTACTAVTGVKCIAGARDTAADADTVADSVLIGSVPFKALKLDDEEALDYYGMKITYSVSRYLTASGTFKNSYGVIQVLNQNGGNINDGTATSGNILYALVSAGPDRKGVYTPAGVLNPCTDVGLDQENCFTATMNSVFRGRQSVTPTGALQTALSQDLQIGTGALHYDDVVKFATSTANQIWSAQTTATGVENLIKTSTQRVGINTPASTVPGTLLQVNGNVKTKDMIIGSAAMVGSVCESGSANCFEMRNIVAPTTATGAAYCNANRPLKKITGAVTSNKIAQADCETTPKVTTSSTFPDCANGYKGIDSSGNPICM